MIGAATVLITGLFLHKFKLVGVIALTRLISTCEFVNVFTKTQQNLFLKNSSFLHFMVAKIPLNLPDFGPLKHRHASLPYPLPCGPDFVQRSRSN